MENAGLITANGYSVIEETSDWIVGPGQSGTKNPTKFRIKRVIGEDRLKLEKVLAKETEHSRSVLSKLPAQIWEKLISTDNENVRTDMSAAELFALLGSDAKELLTLKDEETEKQLALEICKVGLSEMQNFQGTQDDVLMCIPGLAIWLAQQIKEFNNLTAETVKNFNMP